MAAIPKQGYGHSTVSMAVRNAEQCRVKKLFLFHFDPEYSDQQLEEMLRQARRKFKNTYLAQELKKIKYKEITMSGHSKWSSIKHKKAATDAKRGKIFTRFIRELTIAARAGGGDPESNSRLRHAIDGARAANMPSDNIKKAVQRGTGELEGVNYEELSYEGYGPGGVALLVEAMTDNKNRTVSEVRHVFEQVQRQSGRAGLRVLDVHAQGHDHCSAVGHRRRRTDGNRPRERRRGHGKGRR